MSFGVDASGSQADGAVSSREVALSLVKRACRQPFGPTVPAPDTLGLETDMFIASVPGTTDKRVFLVGIEGKRLIPNKDVLLELKRIGILDKGEVSSAALNMFPTLPEA